MAQVDPALAVEGYTAHGGKVSRFGGLFVQDMQLMIADQAVFDNLEAFGSGLEMRLAGNEAQPAFDIGPGTRLDMLRERQIQVEQPELFILITEQGENNQVGLQADRAFEFLRGDGQYRAGITLALQPCGNEFGITGILRDRGNLQRCRMRLVLLWSMRLHIRV